MQQQRRHKCFYLNPDVVLGCVLSNGDNPVRPGIQWASMMKFPGLPKDCEFVYANYDLQRACFIITVSHDSFDILPFGAYPPVIEAEYEVVQMAPSPEFKIEKHATIKGVFIRNDTPAGWDLVPPMTPAWQPPSVRNVQNISKSKSEEMVSGNWSLTTTDSPHGTVEKYSKIAALNARAYSLYDSVPLENEFTNPDLGEPHHDPYRKEVTSVSDYIPLSRRIGNVALTDNDRAIMARTGIVRFDASGQAVRSPGMKVGYDVSGETDHSPGSKPTVVEDPFNKTWHDKPPML